MKKISPKNKIIGFAYIKWHGQFIAVDLYEGNMFYYPDGNVDSIDPVLYEKYLKLYEEAVQQDQRIKTAYEANQKAGRSLDFKIPAKSADPKAAEKEFYMRRHPEEFQDPEVVVKPKKKGWLFGKKADKEILICPKCGAENDKGKKFCGECGTSLAKKNNDALEEKKESIAAASMEADMVAEQAVGQPVEMPPEKETDQIPETVTPEPESVQKTVQKSSKPDIDENIGFSSGDDLFVEEQEEPEKEEQKEPEKQAAKPVNVPGPEPGKVTVPRKPKTAESPVQKDEEPEVEETPAPEPEKPTRAERPKKVRKQKPQQEENDGKHPKKNSKLILIFLLAIILLIIVAALYLFAFSNSGTQVYAPTTTQTDESQPEPYMAIMFTKDLTVDSVIEKSDLDGCILNKDQYEKYTNISTYIDENGEEVTPGLIPWSEVDSVIGKRVTSDVKKGALVYDTTITSQHVIAQKTYVDATVNGEDGTYEVTDGVLPGNTKIQIVAVISTDGADPVQVLLSEMTLKDRSLESIFNSAGQDVLEKLVNGNTDGDTEESQEDTESSEEESTEEGQE